MDKSGHLDDFVHRHLPDPSHWPVFDYSSVAAPEPYPDQLNCADYLIRGAERQGFGSNPAIIFEDVVWSYDDLIRRARQIAHFLVHDMELKPGNRVLLRSWNTPMLAACWLGVALAGGVNVTTMAMLRSKELAEIIQKCQISHGLVLDTLGQALSEAQEVTDVLKSVATFSACGVQNTTIDRACQNGAPLTKAVATAANDPVMIAMTSGTTGKPKAAVHFHRAVLAATDCFPRDICPVDRSSIITGSPPLAFTFGLGALLAIPLRFGASSVLVAQPTPQNLLQAIAKHKVTDLFTVPTMYRTLLQDAANYDLSSLKRCMSAGETLPADTLTRWREETGLDIHDGIGSTEMLHHFIATPINRARANITGRAIKGFTANVVDETGEPVADNEIGHLAVRGPTGCLYLDDPERQQIYVRAGWNITGDLFRKIAGGDFQFVSRSDDMIVSSGYNISGIEVEDAVMKHEAVEDCAVVGRADPDRGQIVCAYIVLKPNFIGADQNTVRKTIQDHVKQTIAPYKYPRQIQFLSELPKTPTGKIQRHLLRNQDAA